MYYPQLKTAVDTITFHSEKNADKTAIFCDEIEYSYEQLDHQSNRTAHALTGSGIGESARIAYWGKESVHYYDLFFACAKNKSVLVPVNWRLTAVETEHILRDSLTEILFVESDFYDKALSIKHVLPKLRLIVNMDEGSATGSGFINWKEMYSDTSIQAVVDENTPLMQLYTSGTTGLPKGVVIAHRSFFKIRDLLAEKKLDWIDWKRNDVSLIGIPGFHVAGIWWAMQGFNAGVVNIAMRSFTSRDAVKLIRDKKVTTTIVVPSMLYMMLGEKRQGADDFTSLRKIAYGGSPITESLLQRSLLEFGCEFTQLYGLTETGNAVVCLPPAEHYVSANPRLRAAGRAIPGVEIKIVSKTGDNLDHNIVGEICVKTPAVMLEYWHLNEATNSTLVNGWLHTGDAGYLDQDNFLYVTDRIKDTIIVAGENIYPAEVENALCKHPGVGETAVVGFPDERWGQAVHAFIVTKPDTKVTPRELMVFLRGEIADFKIPTQYHYIDSVPRNPSGKILRRVLREHHNADETQKINRA